MKLNFKSSKDFVDQNSRYMDILYQTEKELFDNKKKYLGKINNLLNTLEIPNGYIIEAGVWQGDIYKIFQTYFGHHRCIGFDIEKYINDSSIIYGDFRKIHTQYNFKCSLFFNGLGAWKYNRSSKQSGLDYATKNLVIGGYYLDTNINNDSHTMPPACFDKVITDNKFFLVYKKVTEYA